MDDKITNLVGEEIQEMELELQIQVFQGFLVDTEALMLLE